ncbi:mannitol dehydrogenase domain [Clostridium sp. CAG:1013]|nr:mannitol dehydrogenase domain [Clostridium sp. CAG:1013]
MKNQKLRTFLLETLDQEIVPFVSDDIAATKEFSDSVLDRFENPYLNHQLTSILLNSVSKWRARDLPSFREYYEKNGCIPPHMTKGFAYLVELYKQARKGETGYVSVLPGREIPLVDDLCYLTYFANGGTVASFMADETAWGEDLTRYEGFLHQVEAYLEVLEGGGSLL